MINYEGADKQWRIKAAKHATRHFGRYIPQILLIAAQGKWSGYTEPRFYAVAYLRAKGLGFDHIARIIGYGHHTSVLNALRRAHGHDGKGRAAKAEPLWSAEHFEKLVLAEEQERQGKKWVAA